MNRDLARLTGLPKLVLSGSFPFQFTEMRVIGVVVMFVRVMMHAGCFILRLARSQQPGDDGDEYNSADHQQYFGNIDAVIGNFFFRVGRLGQCRARLNEQEKQK